MRFTRQWPATLAATAALAVFANSASVAGPTGGESIDDRCRRWLEQLDAPSFSLRQAAVEQLKAAGSRAVPLIAEQLPAAGPEARTRMLHILQSLRNHDDVEIADAAGGALEQIAAGKGDAAAEARSILTPPQNKPLQAAPAPLPVPVQVMRRIAIRTENGKTQIELDVNNKKIRVRQNGDEFEVTRADPGQTLEDQPSKSYKTEEELKAADPEAHDVWKQYGRGAGGAGGVLPFNQPNRWRGAEVPGRPEIPARPEIPGRPETPFRAEIRRRIAPPQIQRQIEQRIRIAPLGGQN